MAKASQAKTKTKTKTNPKPPGLLARFEASKVDLEKCRDNLRDIVSDAEEFLEEIETALDALANAQRTIRELDLSADALSAYV